MFFKRLISPTAPVIRRITASPVRAAHHDARSVPGSNLPFSITNKYGLLVKFILFIGSGLGLPFFAIHHAVANR